MPKKCIVKLEPVGRSFEVFQGTPLVDLVHELGIEFPCGGKGKCLQCRVKILEGILETAKNHDDLIRLKGLDPAWRLACKSTVSHDVTLEVHQLNSIVLADNSPFPFEPAEGYGIVIDLGTTTLVVQLVDRSTAQVLDVETAVNLQQQYGADIMTRVSASLKDHGRHTLCSLIRNQLGDMVERIILRHGINPDHILLVGNTVMHHLFSDIDLAPLSAYPFRCNVLAAQVFKGSQIGWKLPDSTRIRFMPCLGSFVGSDILAGILATGMYKSEALVALIDLGTNGELAVGNRDRILVASTAAGPAFEGTNISQGMHASLGAISSVALNDSGFDIRVIGNEPARGICGSGLIDAVAVAHKRKLIDAYGQIVSGTSPIPLTESVVLTQKDIYEYILAKAAIASGIQILLNMHGQVHAEVSTLFIAGGFGNYISVQHAIETGLLEFREDQVIKMGNTALIGAKMMLFLEDPVVHTIRKKVDTVSLETNPHFQDIFIQKMTLTG